MTPYQSEDPSPTPPTYRGKEEKGKIVEREIATRPIATRLLARKGNSN